ncbi:MAG TPA: M13-type metalloendopeptidase [Kribbella sp.]|nr:M13-type metalloendopeptidase [Kribbella sp.]
MTTGIDSSSVSAAVRPQDDLYRHANGSWLDRADIPADKAIYGAFHALQDEAERNLRAIVEEAAAAGHPEGSEARKIGDLYASFMAEDTIEQLGFEPIADQLERVRSVERLDDFLTTMGALHREGVSGLFEWWVNTDAKDSDRYLVHLGQGGLGLPDESYYRDAAFAGERTAYVEHLARMLELANHPEPHAAADRIMAVETGLAAGHWDRVTNRDATLTYNHVDRVGLGGLTPGLDWSGWLAAAGIPDSAFDELIVSQPSYLTAAAEALQAVPLEQWKDWLAWRVIHTAAPLLSRAFVEENFSFYGRTLTGAPQLRERWKRGLGVVESALGEALGQLYVAKHFPPDARARMVDLVANLVEAYRQRIEALVWMSPETRQRALDKLELFTPKIGYPDKWRGYSALEIRVDDLVGNVRRSVGVETDRDLAKLGKPVDRTEWFMTPQTVNAYYNPGMNEIVFPAGILQPPFFDLAADDAANYGAIGAVIGHEIGHGFDDQGSKYDGKGNLSDWWTDQDRAEFDQRAGRLIEQYNELEPIQAPGHRVNGALTVGENIGDLGGLSIAYTAYRISLDGGSAPTLDGLSGDQRFFLSWAQAWRTKTRDAEVIRRLALDPHSPPEFRCNAVVRNLDEFYAAFGVTEADELWIEPANRVRIW